MPHDVPGALDRIVEAIENGEISKVQIKESCKKVLYYKRLLKFRHRKPEANIVAESIHPKHHK